MRSFIKTVQY